MLSFGTLTVSTTNAEQIGSNQPYGIMTILNIGGLDYAGVTPGPSDVLIGSAFSLTSLQAAQAAQTLQPSTFILAPGATISLPTLDGIWAIAVSRQTTLTYVIGIGDQ